tara:strand:+ start:594 stop:839 length:246 start_codon:yes stop_codon:yes gene_type:complete
MKIRFYHKIDGFRWAGFILAMLSAFLLSGGDADIQWMGWAVATISCSIWLYMGFKDKDIPRALMELMYLCLAIRGIINWLQ